MSVNSKEPDIIEKCATKLHLLHKWNIVSAFTNCRFKSRMSTHKVHIEVYLCKQAASHELLNLKLCNWRSEICVSGDLKTKLLLLGHYHSIHECYFIPCVLHNENDPIQDSENGLISEYFFFINWLSKFMWNVVPVAS